ncbi:MAG: UDP-N-acetylmuramoyl-L-alanine--D-glutamate ligase [Candidatus Microsaccharimonas sp.]
MKIAIAGYGVEGKENYVYWSADPANELTIVNERDDGSVAYPPEAPVIVGEGAFGQLDGFDMVVRTAGLSPHKIKTDGKVWSATNEFFAKCPAPIIGVTGSKGKGTTASLIASVLEAAGKKVWLVGNIGLPALSVLSQVQPDDIVVYELSSFQLWDIEASPHTAVVLFIEQEHLDVHRDMDEYVAAKANITRHQTENDLLVYNAANRYAVQIAEGSKAQKIGYPQQGAHIEDDTFYCTDEAGNTTQLCAVSELRIKGEHNETNALAAIDATWPYIGAREDVAEILKQGFNAFHGLPHRLAYVATVNSVDYYDDSIATTPSSAIAALRAFADQPKVIILGGSYKGSDFHELAYELTKHDVRTVLVGDEAQRIADACEANGFTGYEIIENATAETFTRRAAELAQPGGVVLLSPAAASFGLFKNYADRGDQFIAAVTALK